MADFLGQMARASRRRVVGSRAAIPEARMLRRALDARPVRPLGLDRRGFDLIAEIKPRSPAAGMLGPDSPRFARQRAAAFAQGGAVAVSVLTEPSRFGGSLATLTAASGATSLPVMRKDFLVDPYQVLEARAAGASGVLLILRMLDDEALRELLDAARTTGMFALLEAFDERDLERVAGLAPSPSGLRLLVGVNCRDLSTLEVRAERFARLARALPPCFSTVAESGIATVDDARHVAALGFRLALVGTALMRADDPVATAAALIAAGRKEAASCRFA